MISDLLGEITGVLLEGVFVSKKPPQNFPEGEEMASMATAAGALAFLSLLIGGIGFTFAVSYAGGRSSGSVLILGLGVSSALLAWGTIRVANYALRVTNRNMGLARASKFVGYGILFSSGIATFLGAIAVFRWIT